VYSLARRSGEETEVTDSEVIDCVARSMIQNAQVASKPERPRSVKRRR
jgi:hypothetical protein